MSGLLEKSRIFLEVVERSGFAAASRALGISRSAATRQVAELEAEIGVQLLVRTTRKVSLTAPGAAYAERLRPLMRDFDNATETIRETQHTMRGTLNVTAPLSFGMRFLPDTIARFRILYPDLKLRLDLSDRFADIIADGYDMALRISGPPSGSSVIWRKMSPVARHIFAAPSYLERHGTPQSPDELGAHACLSYSNTGDPETWRLSHDEREAVVTIRPVLCCNNGEVLRDLALAGEGIVLLPDFVVADELDAGLLVPVLVDWCPPPVWLTAFYPPYERLPAKVEAFTCFIEDAFASREPIDQAEPRKRGQKNPALRL